MALDRTLADFLDETVDAFSTLDLEKLNALEQRIGLLAESNTKFAEDDIGLVLQKQCQLEILLQNCKAHLDALNHLHARNMRNRWAQ
jgi:hypothetical protein